MISPYLIEFKKIGNAEIGYLSVNENTEFVPFKIERVFWSYFTPKNVVRGNHAHYNTNQVLIATAGNVIINTELPSGEKKSYNLDKPNIGLFVPANCWHTMTFDESSVLMVLASTIYNENDYIRDYEQYKLIYSK